MIQKALISIGSNMGDRVNNCILSIKKIKVDKRTVALKQSSLYQTSPVSEIMQDDFINCAISIYWDSTPYELLRMLNSIEEGMGRKRGIPKGPRVIDLDIILFGDMVIDTGQLKVPHPDAHRRKFVIIPCIEIEPEAFHPVFNKKLKDFLCMIGDEQRITKL
ncbi:MAG TPA: 2-amino-4-hydroxy-6-hydroxymethyldihydropteridine diphosphokinase [Syntrophorhabdaceae bacterium]|nr:2-amino-4-hydroxy-6-hydroxymethyldihydropteridine diphosphokinase [Syntrophorhabdaceae bacterium]HOL06325.1 2-amino-4-hydroxy-6-hydroxymethyldihydropteridine diphosphokinase [Syntrophorhabdaceae bacterium]HON86085.1 2-amino-4-hydroxy-6-hydroxymethyldihydropteridine diphosphokinase [Syntrophorhabdaceae bacterium]HPP42623.1 2-amino-4-hydroxy-6-hydroxymethyldihydropteridine diphosphokinase [Syntrophorhabdaceae bacterium]HQE80536.1 2-amino-4-hydroxy-6-hydroxymethyldihydropteridine diphosphokinas